MLNTSLLEDEEEEEEVEEEVVVEEEGTGSSVQEDWRMTLVPVKRAASKIIATKLRASGMTILPNPTKIGGAGGGRPGAAGWSHVSNASAPGGVLVVCGPKK